MVKFRAAWTAGLWSDSRWDSRELSKVPSAGHSVAGFCRAVLRFLSEPTVYVWIGSGDCISGSVGLDLGFSLVDWSMDFPWRQVGLWRSIAWGTLVNSWSCYWSVLRPLCHSYSFSVVICLWFMAVELFLRLQVKSVVPPGGTLSGFVGPDSWSVVVSVWWYDS